MEQEDVGNTNNTNNYNAGNTNAFEQSKDQGKLSTQSITNALKTFTFGTNDNNTLTNNQNQNQQNKQGPNYGNLVLSYINNRNSAK